MQTIDRVIERAQLMKQTPMLHSFRALNKFQEEAWGGKEVLPKNLYDVLIGRKRSIVLFDKFIGGDPEEELSKGNGKRNPLIRVIGSPFWRCPPALEYIVSFGLVYIVWIRFALVFPLHVLLL